MAPRGEIILQDARQTFTTGSRVAGQVLLRVEKPTQFQAIEVCLSGHSHTKVHRSIYFVAGLHTKEEYMTEPFFTLRYTIPLHDQKLGPGEHRFSFELVFPGTTGGAQGIEKWPRLAPFETRAVHPLPPTFSCKWVAPAYRYSADCAYKVGATVTKTNPKLFSLGYNPQDVPVTYMPARALEQPDLGLTLERRPYGVKGEPNSTFEVQLHVPKVMCAGALLPIFIGVSYRNPTDPNASRPIMLTSLSIKLKPDRHLRTSSFKREPLTTSTPIVDWPQLQVLLQQTPLPLSSIRQGAVLAASTIPNFVTFNVAVPSYKMSLNYSVRRGDQTFKGSVEVNQLVVLSGIYTSAVQQIEVSPNKQLVS